MTTAASTSTTFPRCTRCACTSGSGTPCCGTATCCTAARRTPWRNPASCSTRPTGPSAPERREVMGAEPADAVAARRADFGLDLPRAEDVQEGGPDRPIGRQILGVPVPPFDRPVTAQPAPRPGEGHLHPPHGVAGVRGAEQDRTVRLEKPRQPAQDGDAPIAPGEKRVQDRREIDG